MYRGVVGMTLIPKNEINRYYANVENMVSS